MSAFKKLNQQDVFVTDYIARKQWMASGSLTGSYGLQTLRGLSGSIAAFNYPHDDYKNRSQDLVFHSADHLYFRDSYGESTFSGSRDLALQTTLTLSGSRRLKDEVGIISIPKEVYGVAIQPRTFTLKPELADKDSYVTEGFAIDSLSGRSHYTEEVGYWYKSNPISTEDYIVNESDYVDESVEQYVDIDRNQQNILIVDDGEGRLVLADAAEDYTRPLRVVGDIIYNQGQILITDPEVARYYSTFSRHHLHWKSNQPIYTYNVYCRIKDSELNYTLNPSATTGSNGQLRPEVTGSEFTPYITTVGLYNDVNELIAVAKTNRPIPKSRDVETTFIIKLDL